MFGGNKNYSDVATSGNAQQSSLRFSSLLIFIRQIDQTEPIV